MVRADSEPFGVHPRLSYERRCAKSDEARWTGSSFSPRVLPKPVIVNADQTPEYSDIRLADHQGGDFLFVPVEYAA